MEEAVLMDVFVCAVMLAQRKRAVKKSIVYSSTVPTRRVWTHLQSLESLYIHLIRNAVAKQLYRHTRPRIWSLQQRAATRDAASPSSMHQAVVRFNHEL